MVFPVSVCIGVHLWFPFTLHYQELDTPIYSKSPTEKVHRQLATRDVEGYDLAVPNR